MSATSTDDYRLELARERIKENSSAVDAWSILLNDALAKPVESTRDFFESLVSQFSTCGRYWKAYIEAELSAKNFERVEKLFQRCLMTVPHVDLWMCYLQYLIEHKSSLPNYRKTIMDAFDFAIQKLGKDPYSTPVWMCYLDFLNNSLSSPSEFHQIRRVYAQALSSPLIGISQLWDSFCRFEMSISGSLEAMNAKIDEHARTYERMKRASLEIEKMLRSVERGGPSTAPGWNSDSSLNAERWRTYVEWEKSNPLRLEDPREVCERVVHAYEQCLLSLGYHVEVWHESAEYLYEMSQILDDPDYVLRARRQYELALSTYLADNLLIHFALADFEETCGNLNLAQNAYEKCIDNRSVDPTLPYIMLMRFVQRNYGLPKAREVFQRARDERRCSYEIYEAAAELEFHCNNDENAAEMACRVMDLGLEKHGNNPDYVLECLSLMIDLNTNESNARILFEKSIASPVFACQTDPTTKKLWDMYLRFETDHGDLASILRIENARKEAIEKSLEHQSSTGSLAIQLLIDRFRFGDLECVSQQEKKMYDHSHQLTEDLANQTPDTLDTRLRMPNTYIALPYKPTKMHLAGWHSTPGGTFPLPSALADLAYQLPPPFSFEGPFVVIDKLIEQIEELELPETFDPHLVNIAGEPISHLDFYNLSGASRNRGASSSSNIQNRRGRQDEDLGFKGVHRMPDNDIFRLRRLEDEFGRRKKVGKPPPVHLLAVQHSVLPQTNPNQTN